MSKRQGEESARAAETKARLIEATLTVVRDEGLAAVSARTVAARAEANQALIFYHFGSVAALVDAAYQQSVAEAAADYAHALDEAATLPDLLAIATRLRATEAGRGNVYLMGQLLAAAQRDEQLAETARTATALWTDAIRPAVAAVLTTSPLGAAIDPEHLTAALTCAFIGLELIDGVDPQAADHAFGLLTHLVTLIGALDGLPTPAKKALRAHLGRQVADASPDR